MEKRRDQDPLEDVQPVAWKQTEPSRLGQLTNQTLVQLLETRPHLFWGGLWVSLFLMAAVSLSSLLSPVSGGRMASSAAIGSSTTTVHATRHKPVSLWLFSALAISCTAGSILISKQLKRSQSYRSGRTVIDRATVRPRPVRQAPKRARPTSAVGIAAKRPLRGPATQRPVASTPTVSPVSMSKLQTTSQPHSSSLSRTVPKRRDRPVPTRPMLVSVTVVPESEYHPLDGRSASLVESLDLRKRRSLSSWLER